MGASPVALAELVAAHVSAMSSSNFEARATPDGGSDAHGKASMIAPKASTTITPREAHYSPRRMVDAATAVGELSADLICPYPPGIPLLVPGEPITAEALGLLRALRAAGCSLTGCSDPELDQLAVLGSECTGGRG